MSHRGRKGRYSVEVACTVDIAQMPAQLRAHVALDDIDLEPGDEIADDYCAATDGALNTERRATAAHGTPAELPRI
jgi:hypothetical protein